MGKVPRRSRPNRGLYNQSSSCSIPLLPVLLSAAEETAAKILAEETAARLRAFEASVVPDCQSNPDDDSNLENVLESDFVVCF